MIYYKVIVTDKNLKPKNTNITKFLFYSMEETLSFTKIVLDKSLNSIEIEKIVEEETNNGSV